MFPNPGSAPGRGRLLATLAGLAAMASLVLSGLPSANAQGGPSSLPEAAGSSFNSSFNGSHPGWSGVTGPWKQTSAAYTGIGVPNKYASIGHSGTSGNFVYSARLKRTSSNTAARQGILVRGDSSSLTGSDFWWSAYYFMYSLDGDVTVARIVNGANTSLHAASSPQVLVNDWNVLKVVAYEDVLLFYLNDVLQYHAHSGILPQGSVGIIMDRDNVSTNNLLKVDWAKLQVIK